MPDAQIREQFQQPRRQFLMSSAFACAFGNLSAGECNDRAAAKKARIAITFDLEMSRHYPRRGMTEWDYQKGNLDEPTKQYALDAARLASRLGGLIHFFCVARVLEQPDVGWLKTIIELGHPVGNHTYDHINIHAKQPEQTQFRFQRAPWLVRGQSTEQIIAGNIRLAADAIEHRLGIKPDGFRTPGGFSDGLAGREDLQKMLLSQGYTWCSARYPRHQSGEPHKKPTAEVYDSIVAAQAEAQPFVYPTGLIEIPMSPISDVGAFRTKFWKLEWFLEAVRLGVQRAIDRRGTFDFLCHPSCMVVEDPQFETVKLICKLVREAGDRAEIVGLSEIARQFSPVR